MKQIAAQKTHKNQNVKTEQNKSQKIPSKNVALCACYKVIMLKVTSY
jgi:hypothetical protein